MINYYAPVLFQENMHMSRNLALVLSGSRAVHLSRRQRHPPVLLMDRFGRRTLLMREGAAYGTMAFIFVFQLFYGLGWLPVPWFYPAEINTTRAIASGWNWMAVFAVVKITPTAFGLRLRISGGKRSLSLAVLNAAFIPMVYCFYPETKGLELEDIPLLFTKGGVTGGVLTSKGGRTVTPGQHARDVHDRKVEVQ
ncbi:uncharacterized protein P174DRAFT_429519 [Aspergillus novofumigatus IBT 16806]|uniref:Major facilitator superfamily (MFS) profile domain-containing protein n=1 Tax=Aspergillus novofumigatus (strain IBT 16806) TaxID=1392255 RepID=A0A2I1CBT6_ASPN1|nr:uncharacterized protein P174DRAFT_429519 [Aspergillus novofumigatus IBT 16806]PKX95095.1 hypothetical protein P174DRAFT_429519 [Aspergillus novofumigatus IBT 16806]